MKIKAVKNQFNVFNIEGLTLGRIQAIINAMEKAQNRTDLQTEVLRQLKEQAEHLHLNN